MRTSSLFSIFLLILLCMSCGHEKPQCIDPWATSGVNEEEFRAEHHYWKNYNMVVLDSLPLESHIPGEISSIFTRDSAVLDQYDEIVVANVAYVPEDTIDSVWVMVARDQLTMGWVRESDLLDRAVPDYAISRFISWFSDRRIVLFVACLCFAMVIFLIQHYRRKGFLFVHFNDVPSFYPTLLCLIMSFSAALYGTLQKFYTALWTEYYFHPTTNPFGQPVPIMVFIISVWTIFIVAIAVADDLRKQPVVNAVSYIASLGGLCMVLYFVFSILVQYYIGYILLILYWTFALYRHYHHNRASFRCGNCGYGLNERGKCPHCGAFNE